MAGELKEKNPSIERGACVIDNFIQDSRIVQPSERRYAERKSCNRAILLFCRAHVHVVNFTVDVNCFVIF